MTDNKSNDSRRKLLKSIAAGSGAVVAGKSLPESWSKPIVDSVLLPVHAETTSTGSNTESTCTAVDDEFTPTDILGGDGSVPAPGVLANDSCTQVVSNTDPVLVQHGPVNSLTVNADGSFDYQVEDENTIFTFTYTTESGATATVTVNHDMGAHHCLAHDTLILTPGNRHRSIDSLKIGDIVTAYESGKASILTVVTKVVTEHIRSDFYTINGDLRITDDHPVLVARGHSLVWCRVDNLVVGDRIRSLNGFVQIASLDYHNQPLETVYVETHRGNFIALAGSDHYVVKSAYAQSSEQLQKGEEKAFVMT